MTAWDWFLIAVNSAFAVHFAGKRDWAWFTLHAVVTIGIVSVAVFK